MLSPIRKVLKKFHPEGIPWPGAELYSAVSKTNIFQRHYELISQDILRYCSEGRVLDIGTGPGWLLKKLYRASPKFQITGMDISASMVAKARKNIKRAVYSHKKLHLLACQSLFKEGQTQFVGVMCCLILRR